MRPAGRLPALYAVKLEVFLLFMMASAMMDRAELPVQMNSTLWMLVDTIVAQQQDGAVLTAMLVGLPRGADAVQQAESSPAAAGLSPKTGMLLSVW